MLTLYVLCRSFILSRPSRRRLKQSGILRERVFSCDLAEHLLNTGNDSMKFLFAEQKIDVRFTRANDGF